MHISLTKELESIINAKVSTGLYNNASEVVRAALRVMIKADEMDSLKREVLRKNIGLAVVQADNDEFYDGGVKDIIKDLKSR